MAKQIIRKILWIDDMQNWASIVQANLQIIAADYNINLVVMSRVNGEELDMVFQNFDFDLIVMDFHMEPFNGDHYITQIRQEEHLEPIPIYFYSQDTEVNLEEFVNELNNVECLYRPHLEQRIRDLFGF